jgi:trimeric autotransporter adhesin
MDVDAESFALALSEHARYLGLDPEADSDLLYLAEESLRAPVPAGWAETLDEASGSVFYYNEETGASIWEHPLDEAYRQRIQTALKEGSRQREHDGSATKVGSTAESSATTAARVPLSREAGDHLEGGGGRRESGGSQEDSVGDDDDLEVLFATSLRQAGPAAGSLPGRASQTAGAVIDRRQPAPPAATKAGGLSVGPVVASAWQSPLGFGKRKALNSGLDYGGWPTPQSDALDDSAALSGSSPQQHSSGRDSDAAGEEEEEDAPGAGDLSPAGSLAEPAAPKASASAVLRTASSSNVDGKQLTSEIASVSAPGSSAGDSATTMRAALVSLPREALPPSPPSATSAAASMNGGSPVVTGTETAPPIELPAAVMAPIRDSDAVPIEASRCGSTTAAALVSSVPVAAPTQEQMHADRQPLSAPVALSMHSSPPGREGAVDLHASAVAAPCNDAPPNPPDVPTGPAPSQLAAPPASSPPTGTPGNPAPFSAAVRRDLSAVDLEWRDDDEIDDDGDVRGSSSAGGPVPESRVDGAAAARLALVDRDAAIARAKALELEIAAIKSANDAAVERVVHEARMEERARFAAEVAAMKESSSKEARAEQLLVHDAAVAATHRIAAAETRATTAEEAAAALQARLEAVTLELANVRVELGSSHDAASALAARLDQALHRQAVAEQASAELTAATEARERGLSAAHTAALSSLREAHETALKTESMRHAAALSRSADAHAAEVASLLQRHAAATACLQRELADLRAGMDSAAEQHARDLRAAAADAVRPAQHDLLLTQERLAKAEARLAVVRGDAESRVAVATRTAESAEARAVEAETRSEHALRSAARAELELSDERSRVAALERRVVVLQADVDSATRSASEAQGRLDAALRDIASLRRVAAEAASDPRVGLLEASVVAAEAAATQAKADAKATKAAAQAAAAEYAERLADQRSRAERAAASAADAARLEADAVARAQVMTATSELTVQRDQAVRRATLAEEALRSAEASFAAKAREAEIRSAAGVEALRSEIDRLVASNSSLVALLERSSSVERTWQLAVAASAVSSEPIKAKKLRDSRSVGAAAASGSDDGGGSGEAASVSRPPLPQSGQAASSRTRLNEGTASLTTVQSQLSLLAGELSDLRASMHPERASVPTVHAIHADRGASSYFSTPLRSESSGSAWYRPGYWSAKYGGGALRTPGFGATYPWA